ncbi:MAG: TRAP transporter large permease subunit [Hydrogenophaga sp.]|uniref:TRAP transporter large permease n=1 Tax=Hydrogenophaga sp. TaxID=1904254 RepID=UPI002AB9DE7B|nr:TRAP transporter large permease subunit [Hydrogenophaga sp.]MDZ4176729.1 TRAP transporter large permease subunit [Hydrogenophaga sp.]
MTLALVVALLLFLLATGLPVAFSLGIAGSVGLMMFGGPDLLVGILSTAPGSAVGSYEFMTIPMFLLMAQFMVASRISETLFSSIATWTGRLPGGLGVATALTGAAFGAISGSSTAAAATLSKSSIPAMMAQGYERRFASGIVSISGTLAMLIPPSVAIIFYGLLSGASVAKLLVAGIIPGLLVVLVIVFTIWLLIWRRPSLAGQATTYTWAQKFASLKVAGPFCALFLLVTGLIYLGIATPVESSAIGALGALVFTVLAGKMTRTVFLQAVARTCATSAMIALIVICAQIFGFFITATGTTQSLVEAVDAAGLSPYTVLAFLVVLYLVLGCFLDQLSILILTIPIALPLVVKLGFDPIWFGILVILLAEVGMVTPPVGLNVFIVSKSANMPVGEVFHGVLPHVVAHVALIALMIVFPQIILWLPSTMGGGT